MEFERLTADFGEAAGIDARPDAQGTAWIDSDGVMVTVQHRPEHDDMVIFSLPLSGEAADELHLRAFLAALIAEKGPVPLSEFSTRIMFLGEKSIQNRKDAFLGTPLDPPKNPDVRAGLRGCGHEGVQGHGRPRIAQPVRRVAVALRRNML